MKPVRLCVSHPPVCAGLVGAGLFRLAKQVFSTAFTIDALHFICIFMLQQRHSAATMSRFTHRHAQLLLPCKRCGINVAVAGNYFVLP